MRIQTTSLLVVASTVIALILLGTPKLDVTLNESGTELLGVSLVKLTQPAIAEPTK